MTVPGKVVRLGEAVARYVQPGTHLHLAYGDSRANAAVVEILRRFRGAEPGFVLSSAGVTSLQHLLVSEGLVAKVITSFAGESYPSPSTSKPFQEAVDSGRIDLENWSLWSYVARLMAGALGVPFFPVRSLAGSGMHEEHRGDRLADVTVRFGDRETTGTVVEPLEPDIAIIHGAAADAHGNVVLSPPYGEGVWGALAARQGVIATVERVLPRDELRQSSALVRLPAHRVLAVCPTPFGSHPFSLYSPSPDTVTGYAHDAAFIARLQRSLETPEGRAAWLAEWVYGTVDHSEYLARLGSDALSRLRGDAAADTWEVENWALEEPDATCTGSEPHVRMVTTAARLIVEHARTRSIDTILAGIGFANLASWLAYRALGGEDSHVELMAEIGMYGFDPRPGDPFVFAGRNLHASAQLADILTVLGVYVSGPTTRTLGVVGAAQVDQDGNINSTWTEDRRFLLGSGGANDIASAAEDVLVLTKHDRSRLVESVPFVTSPGRAVSAIVTTEGVMERRDGRFQLTRYYEKSGVDEARRVRDIRAATGWELDVAADLTPEPPAPSDDLTMLRRFDPRGAFV